MKKAGVLSILFVVVLLAVAVIADAQQAAKVPRIGILFPGSPATFSLRSNAFLQGLGELGYLEGKTIAIEWRWAEDKVERLPELAAELVRLNVDVIVANGTPAIKAAKNATKSIPIVMAVVCDPVGIGLVASLARPGENLTGLSILAPELSGKRLELLKEVVPKLSGVAAMLNPTNPVYRPELQETHDAARSLGLQIQPIIEVSDLNTLQEGFAALSHDRVHALLLFTDAIFYSMRRRIVEYTAKSRLPAMYWQREFADDGGLMSYGPNTNELFRRAALYVDKILKGTKPTDLPVEQPMKFEFIINLKTAKQIGLTIPPNVLVRADKVIK
jgi:putative tryptophan/tyrosine transport system substrate-binding protein